MKKNNKVVLVTGGGTGIGKAICLEFAKASFDVVLTYNNSKREALKTLKECGKYSDNCYAFQTDLADYEQIINLYSKINSLFGRLDHLVNCAGWTKFIPHQDIGSLTKDLFEKVININLTGTFLCIKEAIPLLAKANGSSMVNISSIAGYTGVGSNIAYCAAKAGITAMTKSFARSLGPNIRVNSVAPGLVETKMSQDWTDYLALTREKSPLKKLTDKNDIARAALLLAQTGSITGETIVVDSGGIL